MSRFAREACLSIGVGLVVGLLVTSSVTPPGIVAAKGGPNGSSAAASYEQTARPTETSSRSASVSLLPTTSVATYVVTIQETGLPSGSSWTVALGMASQTSTSTQMSFDEPNGSYFYDVRSGRLGYGPTVPYGNLTVAGSPTTLSVSFGPASPGFVAARIAPPSTSFGYISYTLAYDTTNGLVYVGGGCWIYAIDPKNDSVVGHFGPPNTGNGFCASWGFLAFDPVSGYLFATDYASASLWVFALPGGSVVQRWTNFVAAVGGSNNLGDGRTITVDPTNGYVFVLGGQPSGTGPFTGTVNGISVLSAWGAALGQIPPVGTEQVYATMYDAASGVLYALSAQSLMIINPSASYYNTPSCPTYPPGQYCTDYPGSQNQISGRSGVYDPYDDLGYALELQDMNSKIWYTCPGPAMVLVGISSGPGIASQTCVPTQGGQIFPLGIGYDGTLVYSYETNSVPIYNMSQVNASGSGMRLGNVTLSGNAESLGTAYVPADQGLFIVDYQGTTVDHVDPSQPFLSGVNVVGGPSITLSPGGSIALRAQGIDQFGNNVSGASYSWAVSPSSLATVAPDAGGAATLTAGSEPGTGQVCANATTVSDGVAASCESLTVTGTGTTYNVTFTETGLATGASWSVELGATTSSPMTSSTIPFSGIAPNPSLPYTIYAPTGYSVSSTPSSPLDVVGDTSVSVALTPAASTYTVSFTETGLAAGASWSVELGTTTASPTTSSTISFPGIGANPSLSYAISGPSGYSVSSIPSSPLDVVGDTSVGVTFTPAASTYTVSFTETGLATGASWSVELGTTTSAPTTSSTISFPGIGANPSLFYTINAPSGYSVSGSPQSPLYVAGDVAVSVTMVPPTVASYTVSFSITPSTCGPITFSNATYSRTFADTQQVTVHPGGYTVSVLACAGNVFQQFAGSGGVAVTGVQSASGTPISVGGSGMVSATFVPQTKYSVQILSQYTGYFYAGIPFANVFGVSTLSYGSVATSVVGTVQGLSVPFALSSGGMFVASVNVGQLSPGAVLTVTATYPNGGTASASYALQVVEAPSWLQSFISLTHGITRALGHLAWNNGYSVTLDVSVDLSSQFKVGVPIPQFAGGGAYDLEPGFDLTLTLDSSGSISLGAAFSLATPTVDVGPVSVGAQASLSASGSFLVADGTVQWQSAQLVLSLGGSASVNVPLAGYTFNVPGYGPVTVGLAATVEVSPSVAATLVLAASTSSSMDIVPGLGVMFGNLFGTLGADLTIAVNAGIGVASISGGGTVGVDMYLQGHSPYIEGGEITGQISITFKALWFTGTIWASPSGPLYQWGTIPTGSYPRASPALDRPMGNLTNFTYIPRYYNTTNYEQFVWQNGQPNGVVVNDLYPYTNLTAAGGVDGDLLVYATDQVQSPEAQALSLRALAFDPISRTVLPIAVPVPGNEVAFGPRSIHLDNGSYAIVWNAIPFPDTGVLSPFNISRTVLQLAYYDPVRSAWSSVLNLTSAGFSESYAIDAASSGVFVLDSIGMGLFSNQSRLVELTPQGGILSNISVTNLSRVVSFRASSGLAALEYSNGTYALEDLGRGTATDPTDGLCPDPKEVSFVQGAPDLVTSLCAGIGADSLAVYDVSNLTLEVVPLPRDVTTLAATVYDGRIFLTCSTAVGLSVYLLAGAAPQLVRSVPTAPTTNLAVAVSGQDLTVFGTQNYGNATNPLLNLSITDIPLGSVHVGFSERGLPVGATWSVAVGIPPISNSTTGGVIGFQEPTGLLPFAVTPPAGYGVVRILGAGAPTQTDANISANTTLTVIFAPLETLQFVENGLPLGEGWGIAIRSSLAQGGGPPQQQNTTDPTLSFTVVKGGWKFEILSKPDAYRAVPRHGLLLMPAHDVVRTVRFVAISEKVVFRESGLPAGTLWGINLSGPLPQNLSGSQASIGTLLENGTYNYTVWTSMTSRPNPANGSISVVAPHAAIVIKIRCAIALTAQPAALKGLDSTLGPLWLVAVLPVVAGRELRPSGSASSGPPRTRSRRAAGNEDDFEPRRVAERRPPLLGRTRTI